ncbi:cation channel sperm-associated auxiliary subunit TMEM249 [Acomys russatus]|uniref:cation channel sperm-associated auxiliary subunit TMEM249 n=1 Tax=Acomys russatus TaxID=60746 RepID=UPI0021E33DFA|nr:cation channel sperm-associated auxiliary subunit TMEM249 [Acomys russatus]
MNQHVRVPKEPQTAGPLSAVANRFHLWALGFSSNERHLASRLKSNSFYPFQQQQPDVFVLEYYLDTLWKGTLLFIFCFVLIAFDILTEVEEQSTWCFPAYGMAIGLWLAVSSLPRRRLVLNHTRGMYHFSISGRTVCQGPMHLVYVRLALSSDGDAWDRRGTEGEGQGFRAGRGQQSHLGTPPFKAPPLPSYPLGCRRLGFLPSLAQLLICLAAYGRCFFQLVLCGQSLEPLVLVQLSDRYEQMEFLGRHIARKLNINYFDYLTSSYRHMVRHWPLAATFSPGIVQRKAQVYTKPSVSDLDV